jgi:hypothetical protein
MRKFTDWLRLPPPQFNKPALSIEQWALRILQWTVIVLLLLLPFFNLDDVYYFLTGYGGAQQRSIVEKIIFEELFSWRPAWYAWADVITGQQRAMIPLYLRLAKDAGMVLLALLALFIHLRNGRWHKSLYVFLPFFAVIAVSIALLLLSSPDTGVARSLLLGGIRWALPIVLAYLMIGLIDDAFMQRLIRVLLYLFALSVAIQIVELFFSQGLYGWQKIIGQFKVAIRVGGLFLKPATSGLFACMVAFLSYFYLSPQSRWHTRRWLIWLVALISILMSGSGTAIFAFGAMLYFVSFGARFLKLKFLLLPILAVGLYVSLGTITGRGNAIYDSAFVRFVSYLQAFGQARLLTNDFGSFTNAAYIITASQFGSQIPDSTYISLSGNTGTLGLYTFLFMGAALLILGIARQRLDAFIFVVTQLAFYTGVSFTEVFPVNLLFALWVGYFVAHVLGQPQHWWHIGIRRTTTRNSSAEIPLTA